MVQSVDQYPQISGGSWNSKHQSIGFASYLRGKSMVLFPVDFPLNRSIESRVRGGVP